MAKFWGILTPAGQGMQYSQAVQGTRILLRYTSASLAIIIPPSALAVLLGDLFTGGGRALAYARDLRPGATIILLAGLQGCGKTTTMRMLTCFLPPTRGTARVAGYDILDESMEVRRRIGYLPENVPLYPELRVDEYLRFRADVEGVPRGELAARVDEVVDRCLIGDVRRQVIGTLSKGYRQRVGLAGALVHKPQVLILDEPTVGLDPNQIIKVRELITELGRDHTVLLSTHILPEVEQVCERVFIIEPGTDGRDLIQADAATYDALRLARVRGAGVSPVYGTGLRRPLGLGRGLGVGWGNGRAAWYGRNPRPWGGRGLRLGGGYYRWR